MATSEVVMAAMQKPSYGVTLVELMVVVAIVGILAGVAYPSYRQYVIRSGRTEAKVALTQTAQALEKCFTRFMSYASFANCPAAAQFQAGGSFMTADNRYQVTGTLNAATPDQFVLTATPQGGQAGDTGCASFMLDQAGGRTVSGPDAAETCW
jgi:type IV pilus assembly protein PilE